MGAEDIWKEGHVRKIIGCLPFNIFELAAPTQPPTQVKSGRGGLSDLFLLLPSLSQTLQ